MSQQEDNGTPNVGHDYTSYSSRTPTTTTTRSSSTTSPSSGTGFDATTQGPTASTMTIAVHSPSKAALNPQPHAVPEKRIVYQERPIAAAPAQQGNSPPVHREILANNDPRSDDDLNSDHLHIQGSISISRTPSGSAATPSPSLPHPVPEDTVIIPVAPVYIPITSDDQDRMIMRCCLVNALVFVLICLVNVIMGSLHLGSCPASPGIPICLLGGSITCLFTFVLYLVAELKSWQINMAAFKVTSTMFSIGIGIWFLLGSCAVFTMPRSAMLTPYGCSYAIYLFTYVQLVIINIMLSLAFLFFLGSTFLMPEAILRNWINSIRWPKRTHWSDENGQNGVGA